MNISDDNGGVHTNSGIPNHACYLIGSALGKEKTERIYYRILDAHYLNAQSNFVDMRLAAIQSATDLYGAGSPEVNAVTAAFDAVGIAGSGGSQPDPDLPPVIGEEWIATIEWNAADPDGGALYLVRPVIEDQSTDILLLTPTRVNTASGNPVSVSDDGLSIIFVDAEHQLCAINSDGSGEVVLNDQPVWNSVALSPDGRMLAATTTLVDSSIYIIDLSGSDAHKKIRLYSPTTQENRCDYTTVLADAMDWNLSSEYLIFDALTSIPQANGASLEYWSINVLDPASETIAMLFPPQPEGISIGNPSFGQTNDIYIVFDYIDTNQGVNEIRSANLFTGDMFTIEENANSIGYPRYSPDDRHVAFQRWQSDGADAFPVLRQIGLKESKIEAAENSNEHVYRAMLPTWFAIGSRPTAVRDEKIQPGAFSLAQNYPNPFNPETVINYHLPQKGQVTLSIYSLLGEEVTLLVQEVQDAGAHQVVFDGSALPSGLYLYRMTANNVSATRRMVLLK